MDKLVEREAAARKPLATAPAIAVQFFLIPLLVVGATVLVYIGFRGLLSDDRSAEEYLTDIRSGGSNRRWPAAYELSRLMADPEFAKRGRSEARARADQGVRRVEERRSQGSAVSRADAGPADPAASRRARQLLVDALERSRTARLASAPSGRWGRRGEASAAPEIERHVRVGGCRRAEDGGVRAGLDAGRRRRRDAREGAGGRRAGCAVERGHRAGPAWPARRRAGAAAHARSRVRRAQRDAAAAGRGKRSIRWAK